MGSARHATAWALALGLTAIGGMTSCDQARKDEAPPQAQKTVEVRESETELTPTPSAVPPTAPAPRAPMNAAGAPAPTDVGAASDTATRAQVTTGPVTKTTIETTTTQQPAPAGADQGAVGASAMENLGYESTASGVRRTGEAAPAPAPVYFWFIPAPTAPMMPSGAPAAMTGGTVDTTIPLQRGTAPATGTASASSFTSPGGTPANPTTPGAPAITPRPGSGLPGAAQPTRQGAPGATGAAGMPGTTTAPTTSVPTAPAPGATAPSAAPVTSPRP